MSRRSQHRRLITALLFILSTIASGSPLAVAATEQGDIRLFVDGRELAADVPPQLIDGRTMVPIRVVAEGLGAQVGWNEATKTVTLAGPHAVRLRLDSQEASVDGRRVHMDVAARTVRDRTMVPLRFVAQALGYQVEWDGGLPAVRLTGPKVSLDKMKPNEAVAEQVTFSVDRDEQDRTVMKGTVAPSLGWKTVNLAQQNGYIQRAPVVDGAFTLSVSVPGGQPSLFYLSGGSDATPITSFTVRHPESIRPMVREGDGVALVDLWSAEPGFTLQATPTNGTVVVEGTVEQGADQVVIYSPGTSAAVWVPQSEGRFRAVVPLRSLGRHSFNVMVGKRVYGGFVANQTRANNLEPVITWGSVVTLEEPMVSGSTVADSVRVAGRVKALPTPYLWAGVEKQGGPEAQASTQRLAVNNGRVDDKVWLPFGPGEYKITLWRPEGTAAGGGKSLTAAAEWKVTNTSEKEWAGLLPTDGVESDATEIITLAAEVTRDATAPLEKARAVHDWVARNISYDMAKFRGNLFSPDDGALKTLSTKKGVCQDYTYLTVALLRAAGVKARLVLGEANGLVGWGGHAWTEAWVDGRWLIMDTTWDAGGIDANDNFVWDFRTKYLDPDPNLFAQDHRATSRSY